jgi:hypothetical protein
MFSDRQPRGGDVENEGRRERKQVPRKQAHKTQAVTAFQELPTGWIDSPLAEVVVGRLCG